MLFMGFYTNEMYRYAVQKTFPQGMWSVVLSWYATKVQSSCEHFTMHMQIPSVELIVVMTTDVGVGLLKSHLLQIK